MFFNCFKHKLIIVNSFKKSFNLNKSQVSIMPFSSDPASAVTSQGAWRTF